MQSPYSDHLAPLPLVEYMQQLKTNHNESTFKVKPNSHLKTSSSSAFFKTKLCPFLVTGKCFKGGECSYAHSMSELKEIPNLLKTKLCANFISGYCPKGEHCNYAHGFTEIRKLNTNSCTQVCSYFQQGSCKFGANCKFLHISNDQAKYFGMKNKSTLLYTTPPWETNMMHKSIGSKYSEIISTNDISSPFNPVPTESQRTGVEQDFFEPGKGEADDFKFTLSYFK